MDNGQSYVLPFCRFAVLPFRQSPAILELNLDKTKTIDGQNILPFEFEISLQPYSNCHPFKEGILYQAFKGSSVEHVWHK